MFRTLLIVSLALFIASQLYFRLKTVPRQAWPDVETPSEPGDYPIPGGFYAIRETDDPDVLKSLHEIMVKTPGTAYRKELFGDNYVSRTWFWGFPDVIETRLVDGRLHISGHLVFGRSDLGVNKKRILAWLDQLDL